MIELDRMFNEDFGPFVTWFDTHPQRNNWEMGPDQQGILILDFILLVQLCYHFKSRQTISCRLCMLTSHRSFAKTNFRIEW